MTKYSIESIHIEYIGGQCPQQVWGEIDGLPFYFRCRWNGWTLDVAAAGSNPVLPAGTILYHSEGDTPLDVLPLDEIIGPDSILAAACDALNSPPAAAGYSDD